MKKNIVKLVKALFTAALILCGISCASSGKSDKSSDVNFDTSALIGTWFWNFGYDQGQFANEQITFKKDKTFELFHIQPGEWGEWDNGVYSVINEPKHGTTLVLNIKSFKNAADADWQDTDVKIYFGIDSFEPEHLLMNRYRRDFSKVGWTVQDFEPGICNDFHKVTDGTKENLIGKWNFNKKSRPVSWDESWIFNEDDTMQVLIQEDDSKEVYKGTYAVEKTKTGIVLHQIITHVNENDYGFKELNPPMEFWYDYKICNDNLISVNTIKNKIGGEEHAYNPNIEKFYYRNIPLETVTYHWDNYTFNDYYPTGTEYETLGMDKVYLFNGVPDRLLEQYLEGWYDNADLKGEPVTRIAANDTNAHEYWAKWSLYLNRSDWIDGEKQEQVHNHEFYLPANLLFPYMSYPESMEENFPAKGDSVYVLLSGKISENFKGWWGLRIVDQSDGWFEIANDWHYAEIQKGEFNHLFELKMLENARTTDFNKIELNLCYNPDNLDESRIISDFKIEFFDEKSAEFIEHSFNFGGFNLKFKSIKNHDYYLPNKDAFNDLSWEIWNNMELVDWYDNPEFKGNPVKVLSAKDNTKARNFYGKFRLRFGAATPSNNNEFYSNAWMLVKSVVPDVKISELNPKKGDIVRVAVSGTLSKDYAGAIGLDLNNKAFDNGFLGVDWHYVETKDKKLQTCFEIKVEKDADFKSIDEARFLLALHPEKEGESLVLSDVKFELVDKDPFVSTQAESKHVTIKAVTEGLQITVRKLDSDVGDWQGSFDFGFGDSTKYPHGYIHNWAINKNKTVTFIWPFCKKDEIYRFDYGWTDSKGIRHDENLKVVGVADSNKLNYKAFDNSKISLESNSQGAYLSISNFSLETAQDLLKNYSDKIDSISFETPLVSGKKDWSDTTWLFAPGMELYPNLDKNNTFCMDLLEKGKANILGDHNFWWGTKQDINKALSERPTFWTDLRIHFRVQPNTDEVGFYLIPIASEEAPYTPVKF